MMFIKAYKKLLTVIMFSNFFICFFFLQSHYLVFLLYFLICFFCFVIFFIGLYIDLIEFIFFISIFNIRFIKSRAS